MSQQTLITPPQIAKHLKQDRLAELQSLHVIDQKGETTPLNPELIHHSLQAALTSVCHAETDQLAEQLSNQVINTLLQRKQHDSVVRIEEIEDQTELALLRQGEIDAAQAYRQQLNCALQHSNTPQQTSKLSQSEDELLELSQQACHNLEDVDPALIASKAKQLLDSSHSTSRPIIALSHAASSLIELDPNYDQASANLLMHNLRAEALSFLGLGQQASSEEMSKLYPIYFATYINKAIENGLIAPELRQFDLDKLTKALAPERDLQLSFSQLHHLKETLLLKQDATPFELPQAFFMRVAMGLALKENNKEQQAIAFYHLLSRQELSLSEQLFNTSGRPTPYFASECSLSAHSSLEGIYDTLKAAALATEHQCNVAIDWSSIDHPQDRNPADFAKLAYQSSLAIAKQHPTSASIETWQLGLESLLSPEQCAIPYCIIVPDLFMQRVLENGNWLLFPAEVASHLTNLAGEAYSQAYTRLEQQAKAGEIKNHKLYSAKLLWDQIISHAVDKGSLQISFKSACQLRSQLTVNEKLQPGLHGANLLIPDNQAGFNAYLNLANHLGSNGFDIKKLESSITAAVRLLDNAIDLDESYTGLRSIGLGVTGWQDALHQLEVPTDSEQSVALADQSAEIISYFGIQASSQLAIERGSYAQFNQSQWHKALFPIDTLETLAESRPKYYQQNNEQHLDWPRLREQIKLHGLRHAALLAFSSSNNTELANQAETSLAVSSLTHQLTLGGLVITLPNHHLVKALKQANLWDEALLNEIKANQGSIQSIERIPAPIKALFKTAFEVDQTWLIETASRRQKWLDQSQSFNFHLTEKTTSERVKTLYHTAWLRGIKTINPLEQQKI